ncbi:hypothetical protein NE686_13500 [Tissierella carlieri]|uniref:DUF6906 domain-containing protein n=1 Tax=Tissierella carlieri TaxID=689904 RepID=A0ABT1SCL6_9FIRM|nr:hypothetical protein [Tissierella carlieri]MCQ4924112.1 hypothetical protein [Tissierella carlieri]
MKHGRRPTRAQKIKLKELGLVPENWLIVREDAKEFLLENKKSGKSRTLKKEKF